MSFSSKKLAPDIQKVLLGLAFILAPPHPSLDLNGIQDDIVSKAGRMVFEFPRLFRWGFCWGVRLFNWLPFLFGCGLLPFVALSAERQKQYVDSWADCPVIPVREFLKTLKAMVLLIYFSDPRVWAFVGYDPTPHLAERIKMRQDLLVKKDAV